MSNEMAMTLIVLTFVLVTTGAVGIFIYVIKSPLKSVSKSSKDAKKEVHSLDNQKEENESSSEDLMIVDDIHLLTDEEIESFYLGDISTRRKIYVQGRLRNLFKHSGLTLDKTESDLLSKYEEATLTLLSKDHYSDVNYWDMAQQAIRAIENKEYRVLENLVHELPTVIDSAAKAEAMVRVDKEKADAAKQEYWRLYKKYPMVMSAWDESLNFKRHMDQLGDETVPTLNRIKEKLANNQFILGYNKGVDKKRVVVDLPQQYFFERIFKERNLSLLRENTYPLLDVMKKHPDLTWRFLLIQHGEEIVTSGMKDRMMIYYVEDNRFKSKPTHLSTGR